MSLRRLNIFIPPQTHRRVIIWAVQWYVIFSSDKKTNKPTHSHAVTHTDSWSQVSEANDRSQRPSAGIIRGLETGQHLAESSDGSPQPELSNELIKELALCAQVKCYAEWDPWKFAVNRKKGWREETLVITKFCRYEHFSPTVLDKRVSHHFSFLCVIPLILRLTVIREAGLNSGLFTSCRHRKRP